MPKIVDHDQYRDELIKKCIELFSRQGITNSTMREIAKQLGVSTGLLYHYFPTKESILELMFDKIRMIDVEKILQQLDESMTIEDKLNTIRNYWHASKEDYHNVLMMAIDFYRVTNEETSNKIMERYSGFYSKVIESNLNIDEPLGSFLFIFLIGLFFHDMIKPDENFFSEQADIIVKVIKMLATEQVK